jgi:membrane protein required for colicin V production
LAVFDIFILGVLVFFLLKGVWRGLLKEICSLLGLVLGGVFAFTFHLPLAQWLQEAFNLPAQLSVWGGFLLIFLLLYLLFAIVGVLLSRFVKVILLGGFNRFAGALFGLVQAGVVLALLTLALTSDIAPDALRGIVHRSQLAPPFANLGTAIFRGGQDLIGPDHGL